MKLGEKEWIDAGLRAIAERGVDAVRVERLAETLKVTKGSFYWHFKDRAALLERLLQEWSARTTSDVIEQLNAAGGGARNRLEELFRISFQSRGRLERGIRAWASQDEMARRALEKIDQRRLAYLVTLLLELGVPASECKTRARFAYHAMIGRFMSGSQPDKGARLTEQVTLIVSMLASEPVRPGD